MSEPRSEYQPQVVDLPVHFPLPDPENTGLPDVQETLRLYETPTGFGLAVVRSWMGRDGVYGAISNRRYFKSVDLALAAGVRYCERRWGAYIGRSGGPDV